MQETFFSTKGRLRRKDYITRAILLAIPATLVNTFIENSNDTNTMVYLLPIAIATGIFILMQFIKRLHDINMSGWYALITFIPFVNLLFGLYVIFKDGTIGSNNYGNDPKGR